MKKNQLKCLKQFWLLLASFVCFIIVPTSSDAQVRIKDIANFEGVRDNILLGVGLVVGLNGTGDNLNDAVFTQESLIGMLERAGISGRINDLNVENVAAVSVTAILPPFSRPGDRISVNVSALGTASSIEGGTLLATALEAADGRVYAVAQGTVAIGRANNQQGGAIGNNNNTASLPTNGKITNGALVERSTSFQMLNLKTVHISLRNPDFTTARRVEAVINALTGQSVAQVVDSGTIKLQVPSDYLGGSIGLLTDIEQLRIRADVPAKVVIDVASGVIVMGNQVKISEVAIAQGSLNVQITDAINLRLPIPFVNRDEVDGAQILNEEALEPSEGNVAIVNRSVTLQHLVNGLNALGVSPDQLISIIQSIKAAGALQAEIQLL
ncbi:MAG: flagellar basal body P-ring protein FlgI [Pseudomonadota bacterium]